MGLKLGQNINFRPFLGVCSVFGRDAASLSQHCFFRLQPSFLVVTQFPGRDQVFWSRHSFLVGTQFPGHDKVSGQQLVFSSPTCRGHNFFVLTRIWVCEYSLESSLNVECSHEEI